MLLQTSVHASVCVCVLQVAGGGLGAPEELGAWVAGMRAPPSPTYVCSPPQVNRSFSLPCWLPDLQGTLSQCCAPGVKKFEARVSHYVPHAKTRVSFARFQGSLLYYRETAHPHVVERTCLHPQLCLIFQIDGFHRRAAT